MNISKTLGRAKDNDIVYPGADISSHHAKITMLNSDKILIEDLDSTNGTFVNGYRVKKTTVSLKDEIRLSANTIVDVANLFGKLGKANENVAKVKTDPLDFTIEFNALQSVWEDYQHARISTQKRYQKKTSYIRAGITISPLIIWIILQAVYISHLDPVADFQKLKFWQDKYIVFSVLGSSMAIFFTGMMSSAEKLSQLDQDFRVRYVCPNPDCRMQLGNVPWQSYQNQGKCFRCGAKYV